VDRQGSKTAIKQMKCRVLLVDDEQPVLFAMERYLGANGFDVTCAREMEEAQALLSNDVFDLVITDLRLTPIQGAEGLLVIELVRSRGMAARVIVLTGNAKPEVEAAAHKLSVDLFSPETGITSRVCRNDACVGGRGINEQTAISTILGGGIHVAFQPIFHIGGEGATLYAFEALSRGPRGTHFERASVLFDYVRLMHDEVRVDRHCLATAIAEGAELTRSAFLTLNVHASTIERDTDLPRHVEELCARFDVDPRRLIFELVEQSTHRDGLRLFRGLDRLRAMGIRIALDDVGLGHCNYRAILDVRPDFLKIDRYFVQNCTADRGRQALLRSMTSLAADFDAIVIAEGIEREDELATVRSMGVTCGQGFLLGRPSRPQPAIPSIAKPNFHSAYRNSEQGRTHVSKEDSAC
jgi:EAL domain-containing protein (putative c-di-GMP-specific phosphodiesterase class I)/CheY-like chemotaxis protein